MESAAGQHEIAARVTEVGSGPAVVFLHGLVGLNDHWEEVVARVHPHVRCVLLELPLLNLPRDLSPIHRSEPTRPHYTSYAPFCRND